MWVLLKVYKLVNLFNNNMNYQCLWIVSAFQCAIVFIFFAVGDSMDTGTFVRKHFVQAVCLVTWGMNLSKKKNKINPTMIFTLLCSFKSSCCCNSCQSFVKAFVLFSFQIEKKVFFFEKIVSIDVLSVYSHRSSSTSSSTPSSSRSKTFEF